MRHIERNPDVASIRASGNVNALAHFDSPTTTPLDSESLAVRLVANRFRLRIATAREVCRMAGIGGVS